MSRLIVETVYGGRDASTLNAVSNAIGTMVKTSFLSDRDAGANPDELRKLADSDPIEALRQLGFGL